VRLVLDTNTVVSGLFWAGAPGQLQDAARARKVELYTSVRRRFRLGRSGPLGRGPRPAGDLLRALVF